MPKYWRISDRAIRDGQPSSTEQGPVSYWTADGLAQDNTIAWQRVTPAQFQTQLKAAADAFPPANANPQEDQPHVTFFVHGFNVGWAASSARASIGPRMVGYSGITLIVPTPEHVRMISLLLCPRCTIICSLSRPRGSRTRTTRAKPRCR